MFAKSRVTLVAGALLFSALNMAPSFAATTTVPAAKPTKAATAAPATVASSPTTKPAAKTKAPAAKTKAPVRAGNFCKKTLVGKTSPDAKGVALTCKADAKGQPRWTK